MSRLTLSYSDLYSQVSYFTGITQTGTAPTGTDLTTCKDIVHRGYRQFLYPINMKTGQLHQWSFLRKYYTFTTTGNWKYSLPEDFSEILDHPCFDSDTAYNPLKKRNGDQIKQLRASDNSTCYPECYAIVSSGYSLETGSTYEIWLYHTPDGSYSLSFFYRFDPLKPSTSTDLLVGGVRVTEAILESCLAVAEQDKDDKLGHHTQLANNLIQTMIVADGVTDSDYLGNLYGPLRRWPKEYSTLSNIEITDENFNI